MTTLPVRRPYGNPQQKGAEYQCRFLYWIGSPNPTKTGHSWKLAVPLASNASNFMTGAIIPVDGGATAW
jgi:hypothetical protein